MASSAAATWCETREHWMRGSDERRGEGGQFAGHCDATEQRRDRGRDVRPQARRVHGQEALSASVRNRQGTGLVHWSGGQVPPQEGSHRYGASRGATRSAAAVVYEKLNPYWASEAFRERANAVVSWPAPGRSNTRTSTRRGPIARGATRRLRGEQRSAQPEDDEQSRPT